MLHLRLPASLPKKKSGRELKDYFVFQVGSPKVFSRYIFSISQPYRESSRDENISRFSVLSLPSCFSFFFSCIMNIIALP